MTSEESVQEPAESTGPQAEVQASGVPPSGDPVGTSGRPSGLPSEAPGQGGDDEAVEAGDEPSELQKVTEERDKYRDQLLRVAADFENFRKRTKREMVELQARTKEDTVREILPIIDNLERAAEAAIEAVDIKAVAEGVKMVLRGFEDIAGRLGLKRVQSVGERFDPMLHDAMQQVETDSQPPGTIVNEIIPGYRLQDRLLRPAMVVVAKPPTAPLSEAPPASGAPDTLASGAPAARASYTPADEAESFEGEHDEDDET